MTTVKLEDAPDYDEAQDVEYDAGADPDYDEGGQREFADDFADHDSEEASQEWYARKQK